MRLLESISVGSLVGLLSAAAAPAAVVYLQDVGGNTGFTFNGTPVTQATFDDTSIETGSTATYNDKAHGTESSMPIRTASTGITDRALLAVKDLFTQVPATSGGNAIVINSATLYLASNGSNQPTGYTINVRRLTTDWLANTSGDNESRASGMHQNGDVTANGSAVNSGSRWASAGDFSASDYTATNAVLGADFANATYGVYKSVNVTAMVTDMYTLGQNYGFVISTPYSSSNVVSIRSSEDTLLPATHETFRPVLALDYTYVPEPASMTLLAGAALLLRRRRSV